MAVTGRVESRDQVIAYAAEFGYVVSAAQLARWHRAGIVPRPRQRPLGRGRGTETSYPPGTSAQVVALCQIRPEERRLGRVAFRLWWEGFVIDPEVIRKQLVAAMGPLEDQIRDAGAGGGSALEGVLRRSLGRQRVEAITAMVSQAASGQSATPREISWEALASWPPSLDDMAALIGQAAAARLAGTPIAGVIAGASGDDLVRARERTRAMLALVRDAAAPLAWLYGKGGAMFKLVDRMFGSMTPSDYLGLVAVMLVFAPAMRPETLALLDAGIRPPLADELRHILAVRDQVPGAAQVLTPMAIRACFRDKEAARRYRPRIEQFAAAHREEIDSVLAAVQYAAPGGASGGAQPTEGNP